ncbi:chemotaxis protein CheW [Vibrio sp. HDW18]|uniref:chemotaxis protein CheW n=1 Tax=Vibrio sp. HDW18 TaxID=2714948 RepID=UPI0014099E54|nr:chemotaxis protein CheW [Vibrio sp. HDW18]QIL84783.1 chemotaxis protein CheW [Vibrio sp. HDW18]
MSNTLISSEQALNDYFSALLDEETADSELTQIVPPADLVPAPVVQPVFNPRYLDAELEELELPNLDDVQRLLSQLETSNPIADLDLEPIFAENTAKIVRVEPKLESAAVQEEIQEWEIENSEPEITFTETLALAESEVEPAISLVEEVEVVAEPVSVAAVEPETQAGSAQLGSWNNTIRTSDFQVLYFDVNGVMFAVPLEELGGIHRMASLNHLIGRPAWYLGLQTNRDTQLDVVDTAKWVMAEKLHDDSYKQAYQYIVMLGESAWGLASTQLMGTELLSSDKVRWREQVGKRPWLAGMVKQKMCALIHVQALIAMLNAGLDVKALEN